MYEYKNKKGITYYLHTTVVTLRGGDRKQTIYYFAKKIDKSKACDLPKGYRVVENAKTGLPCLKK